MMPCLERTLQLIQSPSMADKSGAVAPHSSSDLSKIYQIRFAGRSEYRQKVWGVLCSFFSKWIAADSTVLDLGCGYCEFINAVSARRKYAMGLNPDVAKLAAPKVNVLQQDRSAQWGIAPNTLDVVFTSNFLEHLPDNAALERTVQNSKIALRPGGRFVLMGPNIKYLPGAYWDFSTITFLSRSFLWSRF